MPWDRRAVSEGGAARRLVCTELTVVGGEFIGHIKQKRDACPFDDVDQIGKVDKQFMQAEADQQKQYREADRRAGDMAHACGESVLRARTECNDIHWTWRDRTGQRERGHGK
jgi:hypothetical protein